MSIAARRAIVASHGPSSRRSSSVPAARHAFRKQLGEQLGFGCGAGARGVAAVVAMGGARLRIRLRGKQLCADHFEPLRRAVEGVAVSGWQRDRVHRVGAVQRTIQLLVPGDHHPSRHATANEPRDKPQLLAPANQMPGANHAASLNP
jgi:hypothetical protein